MDDLGGDSLPVSSCPLVFKTIGGVYGPRHFLPLCSMIKSPGSCRSAPLSFKAAALCPGRDPLPAVRTSFVYRHALPRKLSKGPFGPSAEFICRPAASGFRRATKNARPFQVPRSSFTRLSRLSVPVLRFVADLRVLSLKCPECFAVEVTAPVVVVIHLCGDVHQVHTMDVDP